jgi:hypothetical protein
MTSGHIGLDILTSTHGVAAYVEETAGPRLAKLRAAIHSAIEGQETRGKQSSQPGHENTMSSTLVDLHQPTETGSQTGTLMGTTQHVPLSLDRNITVTFGVAQRMDVMLAFSEAEDESILRDVAHLPGVLRVEPLRTAVVVF